MAETSRWSSAATPPETVHKVDRTPAGVRELFSMLSKLRLGFLVNFGAALLKDGIVRLVNDFPE